MKKHHCFRWADSHILQIVIVVILFGVLLGLLIWNDKEEKKERSRLEKIQEKQISEQRDREIELKQKSSKDSFYQKLRDGYGVDILIIGDSIGEGVGTSENGDPWYIQLQNYLRKTYGVHVGYTNISMGGNTSYAGYVRTMTLDNTVEYDLVLLCYGQNDEVKSFSMYYESLIRAVRTKYPDASVISILESSQREYTEKIQEIQHLSRHYGIAIADTIAPFQEDYENLVEEDGIHPNDAGQEIYFQTLKAVIDVLDSNVSAGTGKMEDLVNIEPVNQGVAQFGNFIWYGIGNDSIGGRGFKRIDKTTYALNASVAGIAGIDYSYIKGENKADIYIDGVLFDSLEVVNENDFWQRHIRVISEKCKAENEIKIVFDSQEQAEGFQGMCFSWE